MLETGGLLINTWRRYDPNARGSHSLESRMAGPGRPQSRPFVSRAEHSEATESQRTQKGKQHWIKVTNEASREEEVLGVGA